MIWWDLAIFKKQNMEQVFIPVGSSHNLSIEGVHVAVPIYKKFQAGNIKFEKSVCQQSVD